MNDRVCKICKEPLEPDAHGNRKMHEECAYTFKKQRQSENYLIGNEAKLMIQKNEKVAALLHEMDPYKKGISHLKALEFGLKFDCPTMKLFHQNKTVYMFDQYGYSIEGKNEQTLIIIYHESEFH